MCHQRAWGCTDSRLTGKAGGQPQPHIPTPQGLEHRLQTLDWYSVCDTDHKAQTPGKRKYDKDSGIFNMPSTAHGYGGAKTMEAQPGKGRVAVRHQGVRSKEEVRCNHRTTAANKIRLMTGMDHMIQNIKSNREEIVENES